MTARLGQLPATGGGSDPPHGHAPSGSPARPGLGCAPDGPELQHLRAVFDHAPALIAVCEGSEHVCVYANARLESFTGGRPLVGRPLREAMPELADAGVFERFDAVHRTGAPSEAREVRTVLQDAAALRERVINQALQPWFGPDGAIRGVISFAYDVTEEVRTRERLRESEARFRALADTAPVLIWMSGPDKGCIYFNRPWLEFTGRTMEQELGFGWAEGIHPDDHDRCLEIYDSAIDARRPFTMDYRLRRTDGEYRWVIDSGVPRFTPEGEFLGYIGSAIDITERKRAERRLATERAVAQVLAQAPSFDDAAPRVLDAFCTALGIEVAELWLPDDDGRHLVCAAFHAAGEGIDAFREATVNATFAPGTGLAGHVWQGRQPVWIVDIGRDPNFSRTAAAATSGLRSGLAFPILTGEACAGVVGFFSRARLDPDPPLLDTLAAIGRDIGQFIRRRRVEVALRESEERLRVALAHAPLILYHCDRELRYSWLANPHPDFPPERVLGGRDDELAPPEQVAPLIALKRRVLETGVGARDALSLDTSLGRQTWDVTVEPLRDAVGGITGLTVAALEITGRKRAEEAVRETAGRLAAIVETAVDGILTIDEHGMIGTLNPAALRTFGYEAHELIGRNVCVLMPEPYRSEHDTYLANYLRTGERKIIGIGREVEGQRKDGSTFPLELAVSETRLGERRLFTGIVRDITERKRAEKELRESEERLRFTIEAAGVGTWDWDMVTGHVRWSDNLEAIHGLPPGSFGGSFESVLKDMHPDDRGRVTATIRQAAEGGTGHYHVEYRLAGKERAGRWVEGKGRVIYDDAGRPIKMAGICMEITERKRAEEQQRLLLAELSHRVKNTLAVVQAIAERTGRGATSVAAFLDAFHGRLGALASAHVLLTAGNWRGASLAGIARATLEPYLAGDDRVFLDVEDLPLKPAVALTLALAFHELATNAGKYGALSTPGGRVALSARVERGEVGEQLRVLWREEGGPKVVRPAAPGFGTSLLMQAIEYQHEGRAELEWHDEGLVCRLSLPLEEASGAPL